MTKNVAINNRRYLGNKYKLLHFIQHIVETNCKNVRVFADLFAGTGVVASAFSKRCAIITNDILYSNYICNYAWFSADKYNRTLIKKIIAEYNNVTSVEENYMSLTYSNTYFSKDDCVKIGFVREDIENKYKDGIINTRERAILIASLLYAMDKIAKTCGHYDAYRKNVLFDANIDLRFPNVSNKNNTKNLIYNQDVNKLAPLVRADVVYLDPPYNSRQYCDSYHLLENVATWKKPNVFGVAKKMNRENLKSQYCTRLANQAFADLVEHLNTNYILLSYNNMGEKGNDRSNARISDSDIMDILSKKGDVQIYSENYKAFTTGKSNITENAERIFLCKCFKNDK